ncbi:MAG: hypothetical protein A2W01_04325 [Candidatus Solincola sediminis]|uniref:Sensor-like histidine kinase SenX3 n=1 Tax=Candidatus Solincola sediminis TaxID=1797199 RepID=A0A1F2WQJ0_9ACTN|nr:MAG: hypothetical protein A2W01_04325 [Candidatus Solincola sediminis]OFW59103.1 MAG: hypothetical protein A2Y75_05080 [Candidatus Solincola sediminis]
MAQENKAGSLPVEELLQLRRRLAELEVLDSARREVEKELRLERDRAQKYLNIVAAIILVLDRKAKVVLVNKKGCEILGYDELDILGKSWIDCFIPERIRGEVREAFRKLLDQEGEPPDFFENAILNASGEERTISWHNTILKDEQGRVVGTLSSGDDVTEQRLALEALAESEAKLRSVFLVAPIGLGTTSSDRIFIEVNDRFCEMSGYRRDEVIGKCASILYADQEEFRRVGIERKRQLAKEGIARLETKLRRADGKIIDVLLNFSSLSSDPLSNDIFTLLDITDAKRIRERLEKLNSLFLSLGTDVIENIQIILYGAKEVLEAPFSAFTKFGRGGARSLSVPGTSQGFGAEGDAGAHACYTLVEQNAREPITGSDLQATEFVKTDPILSKYPFQSYLCYPVVLEGRTMGCLSIFDYKNREFSRDDIEVAGRLAQALSIEQERLDREEALRDFIDIASHELRHPITIIKGYAISLRELWGAMDWAKREELLEAIELGTDRLNRLALELLDVSRIVRGSFPVNKEEILLIPLLEYAVSRFIEKEVSDRCNMIIKREVGSVNADPNRLLDLIHILVDNASRYSPPDSSIDVVVDRDGRQVTVSVLDRGVGVPDAYRDKIFERFFQLEEAIHHSKSGMGIGLFIAKEIVEAHGGRIWCDGRKGGGSAFCFNLPL